jgi:hypothetical protein
VQGNTVYALSCNLTDVQNAINSANSGDIVVVPEGNCIWNSEIVVIPPTKTIYLVGSGSDNDGTVIILNGSAQLYFVRIRVVSGSFSTEPTAYLIVPYDGEHPIIINTNAGDASTFMLDRNGSLLLGYAANAGYRLRVAGPGQIAGSLAISGVFSGASTGAFSGAITNTLSATGGLFSGGYNLLITCTDSAGNKAERDVSFNMNVDSSAPKIVRAYKEGGSLKIITDEQAKCYYDTEKCYFSLEDKKGTEYEMTNVFSTVHSFR